MRGNAGLTALLFTVVTKTPHGKIFLMVKVDYDKPLR